MNFENTSYQFISTIIVIIICKMVQDGFELFITDGKVDINALFSRKDFHSSIFSLEIKELICNHIHIWSLWDKLNPELSAKLTLLKEQWEVL